MSELRSALDALAAIDPRELSAAEQLDFVAELCTARNRLDAVLTKVVRAADANDAHQGDGAVSMKAWLRGACRLAPSEASAIVSTGRRLGSLPAVAAGFAAGAFGAAHAKVITAALTPRRLAQAKAAGIEPAETDRILAGVAAATTPEVTARAVRRWVAGVDPDGALADAADVRRFLTMTPTLDGQVVLRGQLDPVGGEVLTPRWPR